MKYYILKPNVMNTYIILSRASGKNHTNVWVGYSVTRISKHTYDFLVSFCVFTEYADAINDPYLMVKL